MSEPTPEAPGRLRRWATHARRELAALGHAARDPRTPRPLKLLAIGLVAYALSPIDLIPDFIPVLGLLDDLVLLPLGVLLLVRLLPTGVLADARARSAATTALNHAMDEPSDPAFPGAAGAASQTDPQREKLLRRGRWTEAASLAWNLTEVAVSLTAGFLTGSAALISWGVDSAVESTSAATVMWRLTGQIHGVGPEENAHRKKVALTVLGVAFTIAVGFILYEAIGGFLSQEVPDFSGWGIGILVASLVVNPFLAWAKYHYGKRLDEPTLRYDAIDTMICEYQTVVALVGLGLATWMDWWWADPVAALLIVPYVAWEGFEAARDAWAVEPEAAEKGEDPDVPDDEQETS